MTVTTLIANIGGMLGLCMGLSFVSIVEIFEVVFFFMRNILAKK